jgi:D-alanyl-D-alanine carboxypeptidase
MSRHHRAIAAIAVLLMAGAAMGVLPRPAAAASPGPLPACAYDDVLTPRRAYTDWAKTLLDTTLKVGKHYVPPHLASVAEAEIAGTGRVRPLVIDDLRALADAARAAGNPIEVSSAYRSWKRQKWLFADSVDKYGYDVTLATLARPGHSEHQLGTAIDFKTKGGRDPWLLDTDWASTRAGAWMKANAWKYGFVMSYPKGEKSVTCYHYEPWHYRYFGRARALAIRESDLTTREWLWRRGYGVS